jgi:hypothetical protein
MKFLYIFFVLGFTCLGQSPEKPGYLFNEKGEMITQDVFSKKTKSNKYTWIAYETKDSINARLILIEEYGEISTEKRNQVLIYLKKITRSTINEDQTLVINFAFKKSMPNQPHCLDYYSSVKSYRNFFKRKKQFIQFYITEKGFVYPKDFVFEDNNDIIRKLLFPFGSGCNYIIIKPDGKFYRQMGEHHQDQIPSKVKADW